MIYLVKKYGVYEDTLKRTMCHKFHCNFLGNDISLKMFHGFVVINPGTTLLTNMDHYERYQPSSGGDFQSEKFGKHQSIYTKGFEATYTLPDGTNVRNFYSNLSNKKRQDSVTVTENIRHILFHIFRGKELSRGQLNILVILFDGCSVQYRSGSM